MKIPIDALRAAAGARSARAAPIAGAALLGVLAGCGPSQPGTPDANDSGHPADTSADSGAPDSVTPDTGTPDTGVSDTGAPDVAMDSAVDATAEAAVDAAPDVPAVDVPAVDVPMRLEPGMYQSPLVQLQQLVGQVTHLHTDELRYRSDGRLFQCSYTFGVIDASNPQSMRYLAQNLKHTIPNDTRQPGCKHLAWDGDIVYTTHSGNIRNPTFLTGWNVAPNAMGAVVPVQLPVLQEPGVSYEGVDVANGYVYVGLHDNGLGVYQRDATTNVLTRVGTATGLTNGWGVHVVGNTVFVADGAGGLATVDVTDPTQPHVLGEVATGGEATGVAVDGTVAYVASGAGGLVAVDVSDLTNPRILSRTPIPGTAIRVDFSAGRVVVAAWNDARVYDVANPAAPRFLGSARVTTPVVYPDPEREPATDRVLGVAANNDTIFVGGFHLVYSFKLFPDRVAPSMRLPEEAAMIDFGPVPVGQSKTLTLPVTNQGLAPLTLYSNWSTNAAFAVTPDQVRIQPGETANLSLTYTATATTRESAYLNLLTDDPANPIRRPFLVGNQPGLGVGMPLPETTATLLDGSQWSSSQTLGNVVLLSYFATF